MIGPNTHQPIRPGIGEAHVPCMVTWRTDSQHKVQSDVTQDVTCSSRIDGGMDSAAAIWENRKKKINFKSC